MLSRCTLVGGDKRGYTARSAVACLLSPRAHGLTKMGGPSQEPELT